MIQISKNIKELLEKSIIAFATVNTEGQPNCVAVACCKVVAPNQVLITDNFFYKTRLNLAENNQVALSFWEPEDNPNGNQGYQFKGTAEYLSEGLWKKIVDEDPNNKGLAHKAAVLVTVTEIWDLANPKLVCSE